MRISPFNPAIAFLSVSGFTAATGIGHVFITNDSGAHWFSDDGNPQDVNPPPVTAIPDIPVLRMMVDANDRTGNTVWPGTDIGVFRSTDLGVSWAPFNLGVIPVVPVFDLEQNLDGVTYAGTHGRGAFELSGALGPIPTPTAFPTMMVATPTPAPTRTATSTPTRTATPTMTATATHTVTPTPTPTMTSTPTATATPLSTSLTIAPKQRLFGNVIFGNTGEVSKPQTITLTNSSSNVVTMSGPILQRAGGIGLHDSRARYDLRRDVGRAAEVQLCDGFSAQRAGRRQRVRDDFQQRREQPAAREP